MNDDERKRLRALGCWVANEGPQEQFLACGARECLYGGAAGGGKTEALLMGALRDIGSKYYRGIIFRRTFPELEGSVVERSREIYPALGGRYVANPLHLWRFPPGSKIQFSHLQHESDVHAHQSVEYQYLGFDELTHFTEKQYEYLTLTRARSSKGLKLRIRAATNPGGDGHAWVFSRWAAWLDPEYPNRAKPGETRWFKRVGQRVSEVDRLTPGALSRTFIPAKLTDTPQLGGEGGDYAQGLDALDPITRAQLKEGDWTAKPAAGKLFKRDWFEIVDRIPDDVMVRGRFWDRAASEPRKGHTDPDWTVGARWSRTRSGIFYVEDVVRMRGRPAHVEDVITATTKADAQAFGNSVQVVLEQDPGQAGLVDISHYVRVLAGFPVHALRVDRNKVERAKPASSQAEHKMIRVVRSHRSASRANEPALGDWNDEWFAEHEGFPDFDHDDQVDTTSDAIEWLSGKAPPTFKGSGIEGAMAMMPKPRM